MALPQVGELVFGAIIAVVEVKDCVRQEDLPADLRGHALATEPWCWVLDGPERVELVQCAWKQMILEICV